MWLDGCELSIWIAAEKIVIPTVNKKFRCKVKFCSIKIPI